MDFVNLCQVVRKEFSEESRFIFRFSSSIDFFIFRVIGTGQISSFDIFLKVVYLLF